MCVWGGGGVCFCCIKISFLFCKIHFPGLIVLQDLVRHTQYVGNPAGRLSNRLSTDYELKSQPIYVHYYDLNSSKLTDYK